MRFPKVGIWCVALSLIRDGGDASCGVMVRHTILSLKAHVMSAHVQLLCDKHIHTGHRATHAHTGHTHSSARAHTHTQQREKERERGHMHMGLFRLPIAKTKQDAL